MNQDFNENRRGFAAAAIVGLLAAGSKLTPEDLALESVNIGEAMAKELENREKQEG